MFPSMVLSAVTMIWLLVSSFTSYYYNYNYESWPIFVANMFYLSSFLYRSLYFVVVDIENLYT